VYLSPSTNFVSLRLDEPLLSNIKIVNSLIWKIWEIWKVYESEKKQDTTNKI